VRAVLLWLGIAVVVVLAILATATDAGVATVAKVTEALMPDDEAKSIRRAARAAAQSYGVDPDLVEAVGWVESRWRLDAVNDTGADAARGGSWGPFQLSEKTARSYGYAGAMTAFTEDANLAASWCALILSKRPGGPPATVEEAAAWWNAGRSTATNLPELTADTYIPQMRRALAVAQATPLDEATV
jgi:soluble lytic murein transglycosylase-like protein